MIIKSQMWAYSQYLYCIDVTYRSRVWSGHVVKIFRKEKLKGTFTDRTRDQFSKMGPILKKKKKKKKKSGGPVSVHTAIGSNVKRLRVAVSVKKICLKCQHFRVESPYPQIIPKI